MRYSKTYEHQSFPRGIQRSALLSFNHRGLRKEYALPASFQPGLERPAYVLRVKSDSLSQYGIHSGDLIAIQRIDHGHTSCLSVTWLDDSAQRSIQARACLPDDTCWGRTQVFPNDALEVEGVFIGVLRQGKSVH